MKHIFLLSFLLALKLPFASGQTDLIPAEKFLLDLNLKSMDYCLQRLKLKVDILAYSEEEAMKLISQRPKKSEAIAAEKFPVYQLCQCFRGIFTSQVDKVKRIVLLFFPVAISCNSDTRSMKNAIRHKTMSGIAYENHNGSYLI